MWMSLALTQTTCAKKPSDSALQNCLLEGTSYTSRNVFLKNNFIYLPDSAGTAECVGRVIYTQPLLMYHFLVQTKLQSLTENFRVLQV